MRLHQLPITADKVKVVINTRSGEYIAEEYVEEEFDHMVAKLGRLEVLSIRGEQACNCDTLNIELE